MAKVGKYELVRKLAAGGMAEVFLAKTEWAHGLEKMVVVKRILEHLSEDPYFIEMFLTEAQMASRLSHPNIVQIIEFGESEGIHFLAMEYIEGLSLRDLLKASLERGEQLPFAHCARIIASGCEALAYAHELVDPATGVPLQLIHRDVSLDNILVSTAGAVKLVDFGIAKAVTQVHRTKTGIVKGKLSYMAPEQIKGEPLDRRVDVYGLGVVLYELLTGEKPFQSVNEAQLLHEIMRADRVPARARRTDTPPELDRIVTRALERDRGLRYSDCRVMHADLESFLLSWRQPANAFQLGELVKHYSSDPKSAGAAPVELPPTREAPAEASVTAPRPELMAEPGGTGAYLDRLDEAERTDATRETRQPEATGEEMLPELPTTLDRPRVGMSRGPSGGRPRSGGRVRATRSELVSLISRRPGVSIPAGLGLFVAALVIVLLVRGMSEHPAPATPPTAPLAPDLVAAHPASPPQPSDPSPGPPPEPTPSPTPDQPPEPAPALTEKNRAKAQELFSNSLPLLAGRNPEAAEPWLVKCLQLDATNADCHLALSMMYVRLKNRAQTLEHVRKFLKLAPDRAAEAQPVLQDLRALRTRTAPVRASARGTASSGQKAGQKPDAKTDAKAAAPPDAAIDPNDPSNQELSAVLCEEGKALLNQKQYKQASALFTSCLNLDKRNADCNLGLGSSWANLGYQARASKYYREFLRLAPNHPLASDVQKLLQQYEAR